MATQDVTVLILNYNGEKLLDDCLASLKLQSYSNLNVIVVDNKSSDESYKIAQKFDVKFLPLSRNYGLAKAINIASKEVKTKYMLVSNYDLRFDKNAVEELVNEIEKDEKIFCTDPLQYDWNGQEIIHKKISLKKSLNLKHWVPFREPVFSSAYGETLFGSAGCCLLNKEIFIKLSGYDNRFFIEFEDFDIGIRAWMKGYKSIFIPQAKIFHKVLASLSPASYKAHSQDISKKLAYLSKKRRYNFHKNHLIAIGKLAPYKDFISLAVYKLLLALNLLLKKEKSKAFIIIEAVKTAFNYLPAYIAFKQKFKFIRSYQEIINYFTLN